VKPQERSYILGISPSLLKEYETLYRRALTKYPAKLKELEERYDFLSQQKADLEEYKMQYLYSDGSEYHFMNVQTYDQVGLKAEQVGDAAHYLYENLDVNMLFFNGQPIGLTLPNFVVLKIEKSDPGIKGDTASNTTKPATLTTGYVIQVPLFVNEGEWIKLDTRTGDYVERVKK